MQSYADWNHAYPCVVVEGQNRKFDLYSPDKGNWVWWDKEPNRMLLSDRQATALFYFYNLVVELGRKDFGFSFSWELIEEGINFIRLLGYNGAFLAHLNQAFPQF